MKDTRTFAGVARTLPRKSFASTLARAIPASFEEARAESLTALMTYGFTVTVTVASSQFAGFAPSQRR